MGSLAEPPKAQSFYESFSDLIFGTLVLFIVLVMAMALKLQDAQSKAADSAANTTAKVLEQISQSRFTGAPDLTILHVCHFPIDGVTHMVFLPAGVAAALEFARWGDNDPVRKLCELAMAESYTAIPAKDVVAMANGLTEPLVNWEHAVLIHPDAAAVLYIGRALNREQPGRWTADSLEQALGGKFFALDNVNISDAAIRRLFREWADYYQSEGRGWHETTGELEKRLQHTVTESPRIRLSCLDHDRVRIGDTVLQPGGVREFLAAIKPGRGFYIEHLAADGSPTGFPAWFHTEVLEPLGFDRRVLREEALQLALKGESK
jgi:hypothetical protein